MLLVRAPTLSVSLEMLLALLTATDLDARTAVTCAALTAVTFAAGAAEDQNVVRNPVS